MWWKGGSVVSLPVCVLVSPSCLRGGRVEWWEWWCCGVPVFGLDPPVRIVPSSLLSCVAVFVVGGEVWWVVFRVQFGLAPCVFCCLSLCPTLHCVCCHSVVGLGWCLCGRVVSLLNGGDGCVWGGRAVRGVRTPQHEWCASQCDGSV